MSRDLFRDAENRESLKLLIESMITDRLQISYGRIEVYNPDHTVQVRIMPQSQVGKTGKGLLTGNIQMNTPWGGAGWGMQGSLQPGQAHALVVNVGGAMHGMEFAIGPFYTNKLPAPEEFKGKKGTAAKTIAAGELALRHESGAEVLLRSDGSIGFITSDGTRIDLLSSEGIDAQTSGTVKIKADGNVSVDSGGNVEVKASGNADVKAGGNISAVAGGNVAVKGVRIDLN